MARRRGTVAVVPLPATPASPELRREPPGGPAAPAWWRRDGVGWRLFWWYFEYSVECMRLSSVHGMGHIATSSRRHPAERVLWALLVLSACFGTVALSLSTFDRYWSTPTVISMERDYMAWNTTFPPITLCPETKFDPERVEQAVADLALEFRVNESSLRDFVERLAGATLMSLPDVPDTERGIPSHAFLLIIEKVSLPMDMAVTTDIVAGAVESKGSGASHDASLTLTPTITELGMCYAFNSLMAPFLSPRYFRLGEADVKDLLEMNSLDGTVMAQLSGLPGRYQLFLHGPGEVPDLQSTFLTVPEGQFKRLELSTLAVMTADSVRALSPERRRCRFTDEPLRAAARTPVSPRVPVYSYNLCRRGCRASLLLSLCGCVPHLYGPMYNKDGVQVPVCEVRDFPCVTNGVASVFTMVDPKTGAPFPCHCPVNCDETQYVIESDNNGAWFLGTAIKWNLIKFPRMRLKRDVLFAVTDLLVHVGSTYGLLMGGSMLSIAELVYFTTLRLYWHARATLRDAVAGDGGGDAPEAAVVATWTASGSRPVPT